MPNDLDTPREVEATRAAEKAGTLGKGSPASNEAPGDLKSSEHASLDEVIEGKSSDNEQEVSQDHDVVEKQYLPEDLFCDDDFPANDYSILPEDLRYVKRYELLAKFMGKFQWMRPKDILLGQGSDKSPKLYVEGTSRFDVKQYGLGDCWFLASLAGLAEYPNLMVQVMPQCEDYMKACHDAKHSSSPVKPECRVFDKGNYTGKFTFRFWQSGSWVDVVIDDRLPTINGYLLFAQKSSENEFWCALVEKAYAKLHGSYAHLVGGPPCKAMEDLTGGKSVRYFLDNDEFDLVKTIDGAQERNALIVFASIVVDAEFDAAKEEKSIVMGHAYSCKKYFRENRRNWFKLRNPWGDGEWSGVGGDDWVHEHRSHCLLTDNWKDFEKDEDGEFIMQRDDINFYFQYVDICYVDSFPPSHETDDASWSEIRFVEAVPGQWVPGTKAGGPHSDEDGRTSSTIPRYRVTLGIPISDSGLHQVTVGLRQNVLRTDGGLLSIGFSVYQVNFGSERALIRTQFPDKARKIIHLRLKLQDGTYEIVPFTGEPGQPGKFSLRVASDHPLTLEDLSTESDGVVSKIHDERIQRL